MLSVVVPAHDEQAHIVRCVDALFVAASHLALGGEAVQVIVVADACTDDTARLARAAGATTLCVQHFNVGAARAAGSAVALSAGARWLAFTDADTLVAPDWLAMQLSLAADAVCGTVAVDDWGAYGERMRDHFARTYTDADDHRHIHGANMGVSAAAYVRAGGFAALPSSEDVALVRALERTGARIAWSATPRVTTSARRTFRAPDGFGATLLRVHSDASGDEAATSAGTPR